MMKKQNFVFVYVETDDIYNDIAEDVETRFDTSIYVLDIDHCLKEKIRK